jgi:glycosyltransferase involved in cell wall biosynthesis
MRNCKISIIIPTYNRWWCIENAIKSVILQDYNNYEVFVVDDWSNDNSKVVVTKYLNDKVKYHYKSNSWKLKSVNFAIDNLISKDSDLLFILDSDDELLLWIFHDVNSQFLDNSDFVSYHYRAKFPEYIKNRKSELIEKNRDFIEVDYETLVSWKSHLWDFHWFINLYKIWNIRFEKSCSNWLEWIFWLRLNRNGISKYINKLWIYMDSSRKINQEKDNLTSYFSLYKRANSMINWYEVLINENKKYVLKIDKNILSKWYFEQFQWCIIDRQMKKWCDSWMKSIKYWGIKNKIKTFVFWVLFLIPKSMLPFILKIYYKTR